MGIRSMQGTSSHLEYIGPHGRKSRKSCIYYKDNVCVCKTAQCFMVKCVGRLLCGNFDDTEEGKLKIQRDREKIFSHCNSITEEKKLRELKHKGIQDDNIERTTKKKGKKKNRCASNSLNIQKKHSSMIGKKFKLRSLKMMEDITIEIVIPEKESPVSRKYSINSNFGRALRGKSVGDVIRVNVINGYLSYKVLSIE